MGVGGLVSLSRSRFVSPAVLLPVTVLLLSVVRYVKNDFTHAFVGYFFLFSVFSRYTGPRWHNSAYHY